MTATYYKHSGNFPKPGLVKALLLGSLGASLLGALYAYIILYLPIVGWVTFIISGGYGLVAGIFTGMCLKSGKVRNHKVGVATLLLSQLVGYYVTWAVWVHAMLARADVQVGLGETFSPTFLWPAVLKINEVGAWSIGSGGDAVTGWLLWLFWLAEAIIIFGAGLFAAGYIADPFCESCQSWCAEQKSVAVLDSADADELRAVLEQRQYERLNLGEADLAQRTELDLHQCPTCKDFCTVSARQVTVTLKDGKPSSDSTNVLSHLLVSKDEATALSNLHLLKSTPEITETATEIEPVE